jgi:hypothetical protein
MRKSPAESERQARRSIRALRDGGRIVLACAPFLVVALLAYAATSVPTDMQMPGTQSLGLPTTITSASNCGCHDFAAVGAAEESPLRGWMGGMMANAGRDPLFWSTVAIAEQDFLPGQGGVGDLCIRCHSVKGWIEGRSTPTNGSALDPNTDTEGIMCDFCHMATDPNQDATIPPVHDRNALYSEAQVAPFVAYDEATGEGYYGAAEYVLNGGGDRIGPFNATAAKHRWIQSSFFRDGRMCGTCHDVSNPAVGDLAPNHGSMVPFTGPSSGVPGGPVAAKAALNNPPHTYGIVERTFSEWTAGALDTQPVSGFPGLPADLKVAGGALARAYGMALHGTCSGTTTQVCNENGDCPVGQTCNATSTDFQDGATRYFTCQTCHMSPAYGQAANQGDFRPDLPMHDLTGGSHWIQDAVRWQDDHGTLRFGTGLTTTQSTALDQGRDRAETQLASAASLLATQAPGSPSLNVRVTNLTGHKLISGYPEGRRMWLNVRWYDGPGGTGTLLSENGAYGPIGVTVQDLAGASFGVESILDPDSTRVYEAEPAMTQDWAAALVGLGYDPAMILTWNRLTNQPGRTLGELASAQPGTMEHTFHFVLNNAVQHDNRIPPYRMDYATARTRNALPVPATLFGDPTTGGNGGVYNHWDDVPFMVPPGAQSARVRLLYQSTSWEYVQFLWKQNHGSDLPDLPPLGDPFLGREGASMLDAWLNTGMAAPFEMTATTVAVTPAALHAPGDASGPGGTPLLVTGYDAVTGAIAVTYAVACDATGHTIHYGSLANVAAYDWAAADCSLGATGTGAFIPDPAVGDSVFFVIVGHNAQWEGSYGVDSTGNERPPDVTHAGACYRIQNLAPVCE